MVSCAAGVYVWVLHVNKMCIREEREETTDNCRICLEDISTVSIHLKKRKVASLIRFELLLTIVISFRAEIHCTGLHTLSLLS